jgi:site-specific recombinase XerD
LLYVLAGPELSDFATIAHEIAIPPTPRLDPPTMANYAEATRTPRTLTEREQRALLKVTGEHRAGYRDHMLYAMALGTGLREHELIALSVGDVFRDSRPRRGLLRAG